MINRLQLFVAAFGGGPEDPATLDEALSRLWFDLACTPVPTHVETLISRAGTDHLLYGSDFCCWTPP